MRKFQKFAVVGVLLGFLVTLAACSSASAGNGEGGGEAEGDSVRQVVIGVRQDLFPTSYLQEDGTLTGYDIEVIRLVDELLEDYSFTYEAVSQEVLLMGVDTGKYAAAVSGFYWSQEREDKYLFPQEYIGGNVVGLALRQEHAAILDLSDLAAAGLTLAPISGVSGMYGIVVEYNAANPNNQVLLEASDWTSEAEQIQWIASGRYDATMSNSKSYRELVEELDLKDDLVFNGFTAIKTWSLFHPSETELAAAYDEAILTLRERGDLSELAIKYFDEDVFQYID